MDGWVKKHKFIGKIEGLISYQNQMEIIWKQMESQENHIKQMQNHGRIMGNHMRKTQETIDCKDWIEGLISYHGIS